MDAFFNLPWRHGPALALALLGAALAVRGVRGMPNPTRQHVDAMAWRLGVPLALPRPLGLVLVAYAAAIWVVSSRPAISAPAARAAVVANALWAIGSVILVIAGPFALTGPGVAFVLAQAALVALFADLQSLGLRQARA